MMRSLLLLALLAGASACDFAPALNIETPPFEPALTVNTLLFADSTVSVRVTEALDPYATRATGNTFVPSVSDAVVTLQRAGGPVETLRYDAQQCNTGFIPETNQILTDECGLYVSSTPVVAGAVYTLRAQAPGLPAVEATATVPARIGASATVAPGPSSDGLETQRVTLRFQDPPGATSYGLDVLRRERTVYDTQVCGPGGCRDTTYTVDFVNQTAFVTTDAILLAGLRGLPGNASFVTFTDRLFADQARSFVLDALVYEINPASTERRILRLISFDGPLVQAYEQSYFSLGDENPFQEPVDPVSNVRGGFGLVGAAAVTEIDLGEL